MARVLQAQGQRRFQSVEFLSEKRNVSSRPIGMNRIAVMSCSQAYTEAAWICRG